MLLKCKTYLIVCSFQRLLYRSLPVNGSWNHRIGQFIANIGSRKNFRSHWLVCEVLVNNCLNILWKKSSIILKIHAFRCVFFYTFKHSPGFFRFSASRMAFLSKRCRFLSAFASIFGCEIDGTVNCLVFGAYCLHSPHWFESLTDSEWTEWMINKHHCSSICAHRFSWLVESNENIFFLK